MTNDILIGIILGIIGTNTTWQMVMRRLLAQPRNHEARPDGSTSIRRQAPSPRPSRRR